MFPRHLPTTIPTQLTQGGRCAPSVQLTQCNAPDNAFTQCLKADGAQLQQIVGNPAFTIKKYPQRYWHLNNLPTNEMPPDALRLNATGGFPLSSIITAGNYYSVPLSQSTTSAGYPGYLVPAGYDGVINVTLNKFAATSSGPAFQDASGMLQWALGINNRLQVNYTNINIEMGINANLGSIAMGGGIVIHANDLIQWFVVASAGALAGGLDPAGFVVCAIQGWLFPSR